MPVIFATQEAEIRKIEVKASPGKQFTRLISKQNKTIRKTGLVEWLK
jgi:hypothetical protein